MPTLIRGPEQQPTPSEYELGTAETIKPESVTATFDGSAAAAAFLPCLSIYAKSGELLARSPAPEVAAGDTAEVTFAPLLRAAQVAAIPAEFANWVSVTGTVTMGGAAYQHLDGQFFETTNPDVFEMGPSQSVGTNGLTKVMLIKAPGTYTTVALAAIQSPITQPEEPAASLMYCTWDSYFYPARELDTFEWLDTGKTGKPSNPFGGRNRWNPWASDSIDVSPGDVPPINTNAMEYVPALYNAGTQDMRAIAYMLSVRWAPTEVVFS